MKKQQNNEFGKEVRAALKGKQVPILVLDNRWYTLFPKGKKPSDIAALEQKLNTLIKRQGRLVNEIKDLRQAKKKLMDGIVAGMKGDSDFDQKKKDNQQRLLIETRERIENESDELMGLPAQIKTVNEDLMVLSVQYCFKRLSNWEHQIGELAEDIKFLKRELDDKSDEKSDLEESRDSAYSLMHGLMGHEIMNLFDRGKF